MAPQVKENAQNTNSLLRNIFLYFQFLGVFPINSLNDYTKINFKWISLKLFYSAFIAVNLFFCAIVSFTKASTKGIFLNQLSSSVFYINSFIIVLLFIKLAKNWPKLLGKFSEVDDIINSRYDGFHNLKFKITLIAVINILLSLVEHVVATLNHIYSNRCLNENGGFRYYSRKHFHFIFHYIPYNDFLAIYFMIFAWMTAVIWCSGDVLIIIFSLITSTRFTRMSKKIKSNLEKALQSNRNSTKNNNIKEINWKQIREDFDKLSIACRTVNKILSDFIVLSYVSNLFLILIQLFNSLRHMESIYERIYFIFSFGYVIYRTVSVSLFGSYIYEEAKLLLPILNSVPSEMFNEELRRLILQICQSPPCLTGHGFFKLTKGLILNVAAAIITYELVLIQFNQETLEAYLKNNGTICI